MLAYNLIRVSEILHYNKLNFVRLRGIKSSLGGSDSWMCS